MRGRGGGKLIHIQQALQVCRGWILLHKFLLSFPPIKKITWQLRLAVFGCLSLALHRGRAFLASRNLLPPVNRIHQVGCWSSACRFGHATWRSHQKGSILADLSPLRLLTMRRQFQSIDLGPLCVNDALHLSHRALVTLKCQDNVQQLLATLCEIWGHWLQRPQGRQVYIASLSFTDRALLAIR